jgi:hypothetical protein
VKCFALSARSVRFSSAPGLGVPPYEEVAVPDVDTKPDHGDAPGTAGAKPDARRWWNLLLLIPIVTPLCPFLFNIREPELLGFPFFYWFQLIILPVVVIVTVAVNQLTKPRS